MIKSKKFLFFFIAVVILAIFLLIYCCYFNEILKSDSFVLSLWNNKQIDVGKFNPKLWSVIKISSIIFFLLSLSIIFKSLFLSPFVKMFAQNSVSSKNYFAQNLLTNNETFKINIGQNLSGENVSISEHGLYQNVLITGTIGTRKDQLRNVSNNKAAN